MKISKTFFNLILFLLLAGNFIPANAQNIEISGIVIDADTKEPIPFVNIALKEIYKGTASNDLGEFYFKIDSLPTVLVISHLSYEPIEIIAKNQDRIVIELAPGKLLMDELVIKGRGNDAFAYKLVSDAYFEIVGKGLASRYGKTFYRQISKNGDEYSELYEIFYDTKFNSNGVEDWAIQEGRYALKLSSVDSFIYNKNFTLMVRLLTIVQPKTQDLVMPVSLEVREQYLLQTDRIISVNKRKVAVIQFKKKKEVTIPAMEGELWIDVDSHKVLKLIGTIANDNLNFISLKGESGSWKNYQVTCEIAFKESDDDKLMLDYMRLGQNFDYFVNEVFVNKIETRSFLSYYEYYNPPKRKKLGGRLLRFNQRDSEMLDNIGYNQLFWDENIIIKRTPVESEVIASFEAERAFGSIYLNNRDQLILEDYKLDSDPFIIQVKENLVNYDLPRVGEKVYLHRDKPFYTAGEKIWFSAYQVNVSTNILTKSEGVLYVNLISPEGKLIESKKLYVENGLCHGQITIPEKLKTGVYSLEAYSEWMKNFDHKYFYSEDVEILNDMDESGLLTKRLTEKSNSVKYYPEGGQIVDGIPGQIGYVARNKFNEAIDIKGRLMNQDGRAEATIKDSYNGIGSIFIMPRANVEYKTLITSDEVSDAEFPEIKKSGYSVLVNNLKPHSIDVSVRGSVKLEGKKFYILVISNGALYDRRIGVITRGIYKAEIPKSNLPNGVTQILLIDEFGKLCCTRLVFLKQPQSSAVKYYQAKKEFKPRERVDLVLEINDENGRPLKNANISVSVLDKNKIARSNDEINIKSYFDLDFLLDNKMEGTGSLFSDYDRESSKKLDWIMLTQETGLPHITSFDSLLEDKKRSLSHKRGLTLTGLAVQKGGSRPLSEGVLSIIVLPDPAHGAWTIKTDKNGQFQLSDLYVMDSTRVLVRAKDEQGNPVEVDLFFNEANDSIYAGKFETGELSMQNSSKRYLEAMSKSKELLASYQMPDKIVLEESTIELQKNRYGKSLQVILFDQKHQTFPDLFAVFQNEIPGLSVDENEGKNAKIIISGKTSQPIILLNGSLLYDPSSMYKIELDENMNENVHAALENESVKTLLQKIEPKNIDRVELVSIESAGVSNQEEVPGGIIAIYTKSESYPMSQSVSGKTLDRWLPGFMVPEVFTSHDYSDREATKNTPDLRSTLYWNPNVVTNRRGRAKIGFYNSDEAKNLQICVQGVSENGIPIFDIYEIGRKSNQQPNN